MSSLWMQEIIQKRVSVCWYAAGNAPKNGIYPGKGNGPEGEGTGGSRRHTQTERRHKFRTGDTAMENIA